MTSAFEYGAGEQFGNNFITDQDGLTFFELRKESTDTQTVTTGNNDKVVWTKMFGDGIRSSLVDSKTDLTLPQAGLFLHTVNMELTASDDTSTATVTLVSSTGRIYELWSGPVTTAGIAFSGSVLTPVVAVGSPLALPTFSVKVASSGATQTITLGNDTTTAKSIWQVMQMPVDRVPSKLQVLP